MTRALITDNAAECARVGGELGDISLLRSMQTLLSARLDALMGLIVERFAAGRVRECHGDLHARNIARHGPHLLGFDCLEFDPALRWIDVADEVSFLLADLEARRAALHAHAFLAGYLAESGDYQACVLLPLFKAHRALVRATITALSAPRDTTGGTGDAAVRRQYETYVQCADHALAPRRAVLVLMSGLSGSGKTWIAQRLAPRLLGVHLRSDIERKRLAGMSPIQRSDSDVEQGLYSRAATADVYHHLAWCAESTLAGGYSALVDATFGKRAHRARFHELAARLGVRMCIVRLSRTTRRAAGAHYRTTTAQQRCLRRGPLGAYLAREVLRAHPRAGGVHRL